MAKVIWESRVSDAWSALAQSIGKEMTKDEASGVPVFGTVSEGITMGVLALQRLQ